MTKESLIEELIKDGYLKTPAIIEAFREIDRQDFVPEEFENEAYGNYPLPIGAGQTISQPLTVAFMLELLQPEPGEKILDIGCGSGWQTTLLAYIVSQQRNQKSNLKNQNEGRVIGIERIAELKKMAEENVGKYNFIKKGIAKIILGDGSKGAPPDLKSMEGFDKIIAAASADEIPEGWKKQLKIGGRIVAPVGQSVLKLDKIAKGDFSAGGGPASGWKTKEYFGFSFVPLIRV